jgi:hypothetical protein
VQSGGFLAGLAARATQQAGSLDYLQLGRPSRLAAWITFSSGDPAGWQPGLPSARATHQAGSLEYFQLGRSAALIGSFEFFKGEQFPLLRGRANRNRIVAIEAGGTEI